MLWQYQSKAEPVLVEAAAEDVTLDKWWMPASEPVWLRRVAIGGGVFIHAPTSTAVAAIARAMQVGCVGAVQTQVGVVGADEFQGGVVGTEAATFRC